MLLPARCFDGELVALSERHGKPAQSFAAVCRAVLKGDVQAAGRLHYVAFDLLSHGSADLRAEPLQERRVRLGELLPLGSRVRQIDCLPADQSSHAAMIELGFEGSVLKRRDSIYRAGRQRSWRKLKARHVARGVLLSVRAGRDGQVHAICEVQGRAVAALASIAANERIGETVELIYSRVDAEGALREARLAPAA